MHGIATTVPEKSYTQEFALNFFLGLDGLSEKRRSFMKKVYAGSAIDKRHSVIEDFGKDPSEYTFYPPTRTLKPEPSVTSRNDLFIREADRLSLQAVRKLLAEFPESRVSGITHLITVSCTGFSAPGFDFHLVRELGLPPSTRRYHIGFMGCYAAITAMSMAKTICDADPDARVLMVNVELCTLHFQQKKDLDTLVANAIFADGISAALISSREDDSSGNKLVLTDFTSKFIEDSEEDMSWKIGDHGFDMKLSAYVPRILDKNIESVLVDILGHGGLEIGDIDIWAIHPGGKAILQKIEESLSLPDDELQVSYDVLREFGNMSSATVMFVLERILRDDRYGNLVTVAFGPGLTVETGLLRKVS